MSNLGPGVSERAADLRVAFDRSFAAPPPAAAAATADFLAISIGSEAYAIRCSEISGVIADKKITNLASSAAALLGVATFRGAVLPVYSLATLMDRASSAKPRWTVIAADAPVALAFDRLEGNVRLPREQTVTSADGGKGSAFINGFIRENRGARAILHLPSILRNLGTGETKASSIKEA